MDAFLYFRRSRALLALLFVLALLFAPVSVRAETEIRSLTGIIEGHQVGSVIIDLLDNSMSPALAIWSGRSRRRASVRYLRRGFMAHPTTPSTMKATSHNRISTAIQSIRLIEKDLLWNTALHDFQIQLEAPTTKENKMKTTLTLITIITSLFFSACANNNRAEYWNARRAAIGSLPPNQGTQAQIDPMRDEYVKTMTQAQIDQMRDD